MGISFDDLRRANVARLPEFRNSQGELAHSRVDGSDWTPGEWVCALVGEVGELANLVKKIRRGDTTLPEARAAIADELADVQTYLDILAYRLGVELGRATVDKFNRVSKRVGSVVRLVDWPQ